MQHIPLLAQHTWCCGRTTTILTLHCRRWGRVGARIARCGVKQTPCDLVILLFIRVRTLTSLQKTPPRPLYIASWLVRPQQHVQLRCVSVILLQLCILPKLPLLCDSSTSSLEKSSRPSLTTIKDWDRPSVRATTRSAGSRRNRAAFPARHEAVLASDPWARVEAPRASNIWSDGQASVPHAHRM